MCFQAYIEVPLVVFGMEFAKVMQKSVINNHRNALELEHDLCHILTLFILLSGILNVFAGEKPGLSGKPNLSASCG